MMTPQQKHHNEFMEKQYKEDKEESDTAEEKCEVTTVDISNMEVRTALANKCINFLKLEGIDTNLISKVLSRAYQLSRAK